MDDATFWALIDRARAIGEGFAGYEEALRAVLLSLTPEELIAFEQHFNKQVGRAWLWSLWGAAYLINIGCSDDGFYYFRGWLVMQGKALFERALLDPDSLAERCHQPRQIAEDEGVLYVPRALYREKTGSEMPVQGDGGSPTLEPAGTHWREEELAHLFPRLAAIHGA